MTCHPHLIGLYSGLERCTDMIASYRRDREWRDRLRSTAEMHLTQPRSRLGSAILGFGNSRCCGCFRQRRHRPAIMSLT